MSRSGLEQHLARQFALAQLAAEPEYLFAPPRRWRFDFAFPAAKLAVEIQGGVWTRGRHTRGAGYTADCEKYSTAAIQGWRLIHATGQHVRNGQALAWVTQALQEAA